MKKTILLMVVLAALLSACRGIKVEAGQEAVLVYQPWIFGGGGIEQNPVKTGQIWVAFTTHAIEVEMRPQQFTVHFDDLMSSDGVPLDFDAVIRLQVTNSVELITKFGEKWYQNNVEAEFKNRVRQAVRKHGMNETAIETKAIDDIDNEVSVAMAEYLKAAAIPVLLVDMTVGKANPPDSIKSQRVETAAQQQRALTEAQRKLAEDARMQAEQSRAKADNAYRNSMQLNQGQFIELERLKMLHEVCGEGKGACTFLIGRTDSLPVVNLR